MRGVPPPFYHRLSEPEIPYEFCKDTLTQLGENQKRPVFISVGADTPSIKNVESVFDLPFSILCLNLWVSSIDLYFGVCSRESLPEPLSLYVGSLYTLTHLRNQNRKPILCCMVEKLEIALVVLCYSNGLLWPHSS